jgi:CRISPR-associated protein Csx10
MSELEYLSEKFSVVLRMQSDWHIGSGTGRPGDIDALVRRDEDDLPFAPAKTLTGIWRDGCETVARGLDQGEENGVWQRWVLYLFGDQPAIAEREPEAESAKKKWQEEKAKLRRPRQAVLSVRSAHLSNDLRDALKAKPHLRDAVTFVKPGIKIDPNTGQTITDYLRFEEMARIDAELTAKCSWNLPPDLRADQKKVASALLIAGAALIERIGGNRRRGAGRCNLTVVGVSTGDWLAWLDEQVAANSQFAAPPSNDNENLLTLDGSWSTRSSVDGDWVCIPLRIEAQTRVIIPAGVIGNVVKSISYIPGTYLLPFVTRKLRGLGLDVRAAIAHGDLLVTNATPIIKQTQQTLPKEIELPTHPVPMNLYYEKLGGGLKEGRGVYNLLTEGKPEGTQLKGYRAGYVGPSPGGGLPGFATTRLAVETHNVVDDKVQRPTSEVGGVFSYQGIAQGTVLRGELRLRTSLLSTLPEDKRADWQASLAGSYHLGRARKDDYGLVAITIAAQERPGTQNTSADREQEQSEGQQASHELRVWLLSDVLLRDERLRPTASIDRFAQELAVELSRQLAEQLGEEGGNRPTVKLTRRKGTPTDCADKKSRLMDLAARQQRTDSWHTQWGLPRPTLAGLAAGSCLVFELAGVDRIQSQLKSCLAEIERRGLGERRAEGYGQICFNHPLLVAKFGMTVRRNDEPEAKQEKEEQPTVSGDYARLIEEEGWRKEIRRRALGLADSEVWRKTYLGFTLIRDDGQPKSKPTMSQLGGLRSKVGQLRNDHAGDKDNVVGKWITAMKKAEEKWPRADLISKLCTDDDRVWTLLSKDADDEDWPTKWADFTIRTDGEAAVKKDLWAEAVRTLIDACIRAHKRQLEQM